MDEIDPKLRQAVINIAVAGDAAWANCLVGNAAPVVQAYYDRVKEPQIGDLVLETSSWRIKARDNTGVENCLGYLVQIENGFISYSDEDLKHLDENNPKGYYETYTYIRRWVDPEDAEPIRWVNCMFVTIPNSPQDLITWTRKRYV